MNDFLISYILSSISKLYNYYIEGLCSIFKLRVCFKNSLDSSDIGIDSGNSNYKLDCLFKSFT